MLLSTKRSDGKTVNLTALLALERIDLNHRNISNTTTTPPSTCGETERSAPRIVGVALEQAAPRALHRSVRHAAASTSDAHHSRPGHLIHSADPTGDARTRVGS